MDIFTIGHSNVAAERIVELLNQHAIRVVVDVRSVPYSRRNPQFNRETFQCTLETAGMEYVYAGQYLGGRPDDPGCYQEGQVQYRLIMGKAWYQAGIDRLLEIASRQPTVMMCAEQDPLRCHRHRLIAQTLLERGIVVWHIWGDGRLEQAEPGSPQAEQLALFEEVR
jgi:uncharacterized protein (DUF488 family)